MTTPTNEERIKSCAQDFYTQISEIGEDTLEEFWFDLRPDYLEFVDSCTSEELFAWQEPIFRQVMAELSEMCSKRAKGETP